MPTTDLQSTSARDALDRPRHALITGGAGFIGSHLADTLLAQGHRVTVVDDLSTGRATNLAAAFARHPETLRFLHSDLAAALQGPLHDQQFDEVYHLAAAVGVRLVVSDPIRAIETNVTQTASLLAHFARAERAGSAPAPTILIASSSEVYGKGSKVPFAEDDDVVYGPTTVPRWSYASSKAIDEYLALAYHAQRALPVVVARFFNTVGPRQIGDYGMVLPRFVASALANEPLLVHGDGTQSRCFCDVRDVAAVLPRLVRTPGCSGRVFNVGSDRPISIAELAHAVARTLGSTSPVRFIPYSEAFGPGFEDLAVRRPDLGRIRAAVGFAPTIALETTIKDVASALSGPETTPSVSTSTVPTQVR